MTFESENSADAVAVFRHYIESSEPVEFTVSRIGDLYHVRVIRIDTPECPVICETPRDSRCVSLQRAT
jgi:hypothetical protein